MNALAAAVGLALLVCIGLLVDTTLLRGAPETRIAGQLAGDRWYRIRVGERHIGYLHSRANRDWRGRWRFSTDLRFVLEAGAPVRIRQQLTFDALPPHALAHGAQQSERGDVPMDAIELLPEGAGYRWQSGPAAPDASEATTTPTRLAAFTLADYLAVERWLANARRGQGDSVSLPNLDFGARALMPRRYQVTASDSRGFVLESAEPDAATRIELDRKLRPRRMNLAGIFELTRVSRTAALAPRTALQAAAYHVPLDQRLVDHTRITRLRLAAEGDANARQLWPDLVLDDTRGAAERAADDEPSDVIELSRGTRADPEAANRLLAATDLHPADDPALRALARQAVAGTTTGSAQVAALTEYVHEYLRYRADAPPQSVRGLLDTPEGDCTEFADLLTTLARSLGLPARTVFGLAYADGPEPAFAFHAWNEVEADGTWHVVDPTWNQLVVDATHLPLPADVATTLQWLTGSGTLRFRVLAATY